MESGATALPTVIQKNLHCHAQERCRSSAPDKPTGMCGKNDISSVPQTLERSSNGELRSRPFYGVLFFLNHKKLGAKVV